MSRWPVTPRLRFILAQLGELKEPESDDGQECPCLSGRSPARSRCAIAESWRWQEVQNAKLYKDTGRTAGGLAGHLYCCVSRQNAERNMILQLPSFRKVGGRAMMNLSHESKVVMMVSSGDAESR
ncbi:hypothetical protein KCP69_22060 [Salmonella enterica subsp. enterica]|nr:hypothetical protein KCP69_22060 [Salmonella enterica subsp. enterica]